MHKLLGPAVNQSAAVFVFLRARARRSVVQATVYEKTLMTTNQHFSTEPRNHWLRLNVFLFRGL